MRKERQRVNHTVEWKPALFHAIPVSLFVLGLFYYWFAVANRYIIFLYGHMGATPFDKITSSRYWMSGLVASGAVMVLYVIANWLLGRVARASHRSYCPPAWWRVWLFCAMPLVIGIPFITMTLNRPTLPLSYAVNCLVATLVGLAFALTPGSLAGQQPLELIWLVVDGIGLIPSLLLLRSLELPGRGLVEIPNAYSVALGSMLAGVAWLRIVTSWQVKRRRLQTQASRLFVTGICLSYVLMPLVHYLLFVPPQFRYITTSANIFAYGMGTQLLSLVVAAVLAIETTRLRRRLQLRITPAYGG